MSPRKGEKQPPKLLQSGLTKRWYLVTRYTESENGTIISEEKVDVTEEVVETMRYTIHQLRMRWREHEARFPNIEAGAKGTFTRWLGEQAVAWPGEWDDLPRV